MAATERKRAISWAFDGSIMAVGATIGVLAIVGLLLDDRFDSQWALALLVGPPIIVVMSASRWS